MNSCKLDFGGMHPVKNVTDNGGKCRISILKVRPGIIGLFII